MSELLEPIAVHVTGPRPIDELWVTLDPGVTAFYGMNGSGKSRLIGAVTALLRGEAHHGGSVLCRTDQWRLYDFIDTPLERALWSVALEYGVPGCGGTPDAPELVAEETVRYSDVLDKVLDVDTGFDDAGAGFMFSVAEQGLWILEPVPARRGVWVATPAWTASKFDDMWADDANDLLTDVRKAVAAANGPDLAELSDLSTHPLLCRSPFAQAVAEHDLGAIVSEAARLADSTVHPYPLFAPQWLPRQLAELEVELAHVVTADADAVHQVSPRTSIAISQFHTQVEAAHKKRTDDGWLDDPPDLTKLTDDFADAIAAAATRTLQTAMRQGVTLVAHVDHDVSGRDRTAVDWIAREVGAPDITLADLSSAQRHWACLAIELATRDELRRSEIRYTRQGVRSRYEAEIYELDLALDECHVIKTADDQAWEAHDVNVMYGHETSEEHDELTARITPFDYSYGETQMETYGPFSEDPADYHDFVDEDAQREQEELQARRDTAYNKMAEAEEAHFKLFPLPPLVLVIDEPEGGLHRSAERHAAAELQRYATQNRMPMVVATHSPAFLRERGVNVRLLQRMGHERTSSIEPVKRAVDTHSPVLGLDKHDWLGIFRLIVLVEGRHDEVVLNEVLGEALWNERVHVIPLHGGKEVSHAADARLLMDFTDQPVACVIDKVHSGVVNRLFDGLRELDAADSEGIDAFVRDVKSALPEKLPEFDWVVKLARRAKELGSLDRFTVYGLPRDDIVHYLPPGPMVPGAKSWDDLIAAHAEACEQAGKSVGPLKPWLARKYNADFGDTAISAACAELDEIPKDFTDLLARLEALGS